MKMKTIAVNVVLSVTKSGDQSKVETNEPNLSSDEGSATITASITVGAQTYSDTCTVTVTA